MQITKYNSLSERIRYSKIYRAPEWIWRKLSLGQNTKECLVKMRLGHKMNIIPGQGYLKSVVLARQYHDDNVFIMKKFLKPGSVVLDIGANVGLYSCAYAQYFKDLNISIFSIEAFYPNFCQLKKNCELNQFSNINFFNIAFGDKEGELAMLAPDENFVGNLAGANVLSDRDKKEASNLNHKKFITKMTTLDKWAVEHNIESCDFIKIDIEGAEYFTFIGGRNFIIKTRPAIQTEFNMYWLNNVGVQSNQFLEFFKDLNYVIALEKEHSYDFITNEKFKELTENSSEIFDILFIPKEKV
jgi:FkbM family methyltransferase